MKHRPKKDMQFYLRNWDDPLAKLIIKKGEWFIGRAKVDDYEIATKWRKSERPKAQQCFFNAQAFCMENQGYRYLEGYMLIGGWPLQHAWIVMKDGNVVDFTLEAVLRKAKREHNLVDDRPPLYYGVEVPRRFVVQRIVDCGYSEPIAVRYYA
jgi:hypothetical protein